MHVFATIAGAVLILAVLLDAFETVVLPRRVQRHFRITAWFYRNTWSPWRKITSHIRSASQRENFLAYFGPLSLIFLLMFWAMGLIFGFAVLQYGAGEHVQLSNEPITFGRLLYHSGETFFTLGYGDIVPTSPLSRALAVVEAGMGFGFLGTVIGYLPTIYSSFSRRELQISLLDAHAGSPPTGAELLARLGNSPQQRLLDQVLRDWERSASEVLESHISYVPLVFFRSQHINQSWLGALTAILDATALVMAGVDELRTEQAQLTFAMARHAVVDLAQVVRAQFDPGSPDRLSPEQLAQVRESLSRRGLRLKEGPEFEATLASLRAMYEPYAQALAGRLLITLPPWVHEWQPKDNWQAGPWDRLIQSKNLAGLEQRAELRRRADEHF
ncbi:MAG TPA: potassium channel family protein [Terriglobales bacterium]|nr:potassium channel family protein [Terriglobales bacterium]